MKADKKILLVEDEVVIALAEAEMLESYGFEVITAVTGEEAIEVTEKSGDLDLILMDINLGNGIDGTEAAVAILGKMEIPLIFLSSHTEKEIVERTEGITSYGYIVKNSGETVLLASIKMAFKLYESNKKLAEEKEYLHAIFNSIDDAVITTDTDGVINRMNPVAESLTGWNTEEAEGRQLSQVFTVLNSGSGLIVIPPEKTVPENGPIDGYAGQAVLKSKAGAEHMISNITSPIKDADGTISGAVLVFRDISREFEIQEERTTVVEFLQMVNECKSTDELIRKSTYFFKEKSGFEAVGIRFKDGHDYPYYETRGFPEEFVRLENHLCLNNEGDPVFDSSGSPVLSCMCGTVIDGGFDPSKPFFTGKGSFWANSTSRLLAETSDEDRQRRTRNRCNGEGYESVGLFALCDGQENLGLIQLNDRKTERFTQETLMLWERLADYLAVALSKFRVQDALCESEKKSGEYLDELEKLFNLVPDMICLASTEDWYFKKINKAWTDVLGFTQEELLSLSFKEFIHPDDIQATILEMEKQIAGESTSHFVNRYRAKDGRYKYFEWTGTPAHNNYFFAAVRDITERKKAKTAL